MPQLVGLPNTRRPLTCKQVRTAKQALRQMNTRRAVTAAGSMGAINVWRDDAKQLRSHFMRYRLTLSEVTHPNIESLSKWLNRWWPELERVAPAPAPAVEEREP